MREADLRIKFKKKDMTEGEIAGVLLNILEHIAQEREHWADTGVLENIFDIEPVVLATPGNETLAKDVNRNIREGYYLSLEQHEAETVELHYRNMLISDVQALLRKEPNLGTEDAVKQVLTQTGREILPHVVESITQGVERRANVSTKGD